MLKHAGALPSEARVRAMTDGDYLYCLLHERLDYEDMLERLCPDCRKRAEEKHCGVCGVPLENNAIEENTGFDWERFQRLKKGV